MKGAELDKVKTMTLWFVYEPLPEGWPGQHEYLAGLYDDQHKSKAFAHARSVLGRVVKKTV